MVRKKTQGKQASYLDHHSCPKSLLRSMSEVNKGAYPLDDYRLFLDCLGAQPGNNQLSVGLILVYVY
jgi:hypothetical protein